MSGEPSSLSSAEHAFLAAYCDTALARRDDRYFRARAAYWRAWCIEGVIGLVGLSLLGWSGEALGLLLVAGFWLNWVLDVVQYRVHRPAIVKAHRAEAEDLAFWGLVKVLRGRLRHRPGAAAGPLPGVGLLFDLIFGAAATALILDFIPPEAWRAVLASSWGLGLVGLLVAVATTLRARFRPDERGEVTLPKFRFAQRGIGLLLVVFAAGAAGTGRWIVLVYAFFVLMGLVEGVAGARMERASADWVRRQRDRV